MKLKFEHRLGNESEGNYNYKGSDPKSFCFKDCQKLKVHTIIIIMYFHSCDYLCCSWPSFVNAHNVHVTKRWTN